VGLAAAPRTRGGARRSPTFIEAPSPFGGGGPRATQAFSIFKDSPADAGTTGTSAAPTSTPPITARRRSPSQAPIIPRSPERARSGAGGTDRPGTGRLARVRTAGGSLGRGGPAGGSPPPPHSAP